MTANNTLDRESVASLIFEQWAAAHLGPVSTMMKSIMRSRVLAVALCSGITLGAQVSRAGTAEDEALAIAHKAIVHDLKDPSSAQFRDETVRSQTLTDGSTGYIICGEMNAKNSYGAYVGFVPYYVAGNSGKFRTEENGGYFDILYNALCKTPPKQGKTSRGR
jgi:hypothetical protein